MSDAMRLKLRTSVPVSPGAPSSPARAERSPAETRSAAAATAMIGRLIRRAMTIATLPLASIDISPIRLMKPRSRTSMAFPL